MRLKSFTTYGFKSFAEKTELSFDPGITAIVGPNGSGKSNISDAIRWALGEQSAKYLRGSKMEDVIFSGSGKRKPLGVAEVSLTFDNSDHKLPLDFEEVNIARRIYRSGDSDYTINRKSCRLKDIIDLLADTGLGKGSMAIIGQNKIDEILNSRPEERRGIFEEAAGIAKYRLRKKEAMRKLEDTANNLTRINDIRVEVDNQVQPLAEAAEKTKEFNLLSAELRACRLTVLCRKLLQLKSQSKILEDRKQLLNQELAENTAILGKKEVMGTELQLAFDQLMEDFAKLQETIKDKETALEKLRGQRDVLDERIAQSNNTIQRTEERNTKLNSQADTLEKEMAKLAEEFDVLDDARAKADLKVQLLTKQKEEQATQLENANSEVQDMQSSFFSNVQALIKLRNDLHALENDQDQRVRQREALKKKIVEVEEESSQLEEEYRRLLEEQSRLNNEGQRLMDSVKSLQEQLGAKKSGLQELQRKQQDCQRRLTSWETREQSLSRMQNSLEGFSYAIKALMRAEAPWREEILGVAAQLIKVPDQYVAALETALGEGAQNIVARKAEAAKQAINYLKQNNSGRATFLPLDTIQKRTPNNEELALTRMPGVCGFAYDLIQVEPEASEALRFLLGRVLIAENMDVALKAAKACKYRLRVVTLEGDVVNAGGSMSGGSRKQKEGYLSREKEIHEAQKQVKQLRKEMLELQETLEAAEEELHKLERRLELENSSLQQKSLQSRDLKLRLERTDKDKSAAMERLSRYYEDRSAISKQYMENRDKVKALQAQVQQQENADSEAKAQLEELQKTIARLGSQVTATDNLLKDAEILLETSKTKTDFVAQQMTKLDEDTLALRQEAKQNLADIEQLNQVINKCREDIAAKEKEQQQLLDELGKFVSGKEEFTEKRHELQSRQQEVAQEIEIARRQVTTSENKLRMLELDNARLTSDYNHSLEQLEQDYQLNEEQALEQPLLEEEDAILHKRESRLVVKITALGPVNPNAIEEYEAIKERSEFLRKQYEDLFQAKENLETVVADINSGMSKRFREAFKKINEYFAQCYVKLFGGGTALLKLTEPDNMLESGIDIEVQPPGKKLQSLFLMSGGERALTVIALLFALLSYQPAPFCILDEIDAPLDDANIIRFSKFLHDYAANTQFIMITHRKGTMETADIMYGVTMEESGVSKLLSVKINEKEKS